MRLMRFAVAVAVALSLTCAAQAAQKQKAKGKKAQTVRGTVVEVKKDEGKAEGTLKVKVQPKKNAATAEPVEKTFKISDTTKVVRITGKKGDKQETPATLADIQAGGTVVLKVKGDTAEQVTLQGKKKNKKAGQ